MILSTLLSDALVLVTALWAARVCYQARNHGAYAALGFALIAVAAATGCARFAGVSALAGAHESLSRLAQLLGLPLIALSFLAVEFHWHMRRLAWAGVGLTPLGMLALGLSHYSAQAWNLPSVLANAALVAVAWRRRARNLPASLFLMAAVALVTGSGLWIGPVSGEEWGWLRPLDVFHAALSAGHVLMAMAVQRMWSSNAEGAAEETKTGRQ